MKNNHKVENKSNPLVSALRSLEPTGPSGFEKLIKELLEGVTGRRFFLARSGDQEGRDITSDHRSNSVIAVECKRYGKSTEYKERELIGELWQAAERIPYLDLWILVTSRNIDSRLNERLDRQAQSLGFEFYAISSEDDSPGNLDVLCANSQRILEKYLGSTDAWEDIKKWSTDIRADENYNSNLTRIQNDLQPEVMGYENWKRGNNSWFISCLRTEKESISHYKQKLNVTDPETKFVPRREASGKLDSWYDHWEQAHLPLVLLGKEGDGKTWTVVEWLTRKVEDDIPFPPILFLNSQQVTSDDPVVLLSKVLANRQVKRSEDYWRERICRWLSRGHSAYPVLVLVLDGINERGTPQFWRNLLYALTLPPFEGKIALLITSRNGFWSNHFPSIRDLEYDEWVLPPYNDEELANALSHFDLKRKDIASGLEPLIRKPRYFDLMVRFREEMTQSGDVTVARLIYEDWRDRYRRKINTPLTYEEFQNLLRDLAQNHLDSTTYLKDSDIAPLIPFSDQKHESLQELSTGGILEGSGGRYKVNERMLSLGFGILLADLVKHEIVEGRQNELDESVHAWLDPREMDIKAEICEMAAYHALVSSGYPRIGRTVLLRSWLEVQNPGPDFAERFPAYYPLDPKAYIQLAERIWSDGSDNQWGQDLILYVLLKWRNLDQIEPLLAETFGRWLGYVHPAGFPHQRGMKHEKENEAREKVQQRLSLDLSAGEAQLAGHQLTIVEDDGLLRLGRLALAVISHLRRVPYIHAIATGCLAEAVMDYPEKYELFAWVICSSEDPLETVVIDEAKRLMQENGIAPNQAAYRLLSFIGTTKAKQLQRQLPDELFENPWRKFFGENPCSHTTPWPVDICQKCLETSNLDPKSLANNLRKCSLNPMFNIPESLCKNFESYAQSIEPENIWVAMMSTSEDHNIDISEPVFCSHVPNSYAGLLRSVVLTAGTRDEMPLRQLAFRLKEISPLLGDSEFTLLSGVWQRIIKNGDLTNDHVRLTENLLFGYVLGILESDEQINSLLVRPVDADDFLNYEQSFKQPKSWDFLEDRLICEENTRQLQRVLWYVATFAQTIPESMALKLSVFLKHDDSFIRSLALRTIYSSKNAEQARRIIDEGWSWNANHHQDENYWGSLIISEYGDELSYSEIRNLIHPTILSHAVLTRGKKPYEISQHSDDIDLIWNSIANQAPDLPDDFPRTHANYSTGELELQSPWLGLSSDYYSHSFQYRARQSFWGGASNSLRVEEFQRRFDLNLQEQERNAARKILRETINEQIQAGNHWFSRAFDHRILEDIIFHRQGLVDKWLSAVFEKDARSSQLLFKGRSFYESLCRVLLKVDTDNGLQLYWQLRQTYAPINFIDEAKIPLLDYALFDAPDIEETREAWDCRLLECKTDREILEIVIAAQRSNGKDWLWDRVESGLKSEILLEYARSIELLAFLREENAGNRLEALKTELPDTWLRRLARNSYYRWQMNSWAKQWFKKFLTHEDIVESWAAFRLFLRCVDSRYWRWRTEVIELHRQAELGERLVFLNQNHSIIEKMVEKNEKELREQFFGHKLLQDQAWPWMQRYVSD